MDTPSQIRKELGGDFDAHIPIDFWKYDKIIYQLDNTKYLDYNDLDKVIDLKSYALEKVRFHKFEKCNNFGNRELWYLLKFFFIGSLFHHLDPKNFALFCGEVPKGLKIRCSCGSLLSDIYWLKGYYEQHPFLTQFIPIHEFYIRVSDKCPRCKSIVLIFRTSHGILNTLMLFFNFLNPSRNYELYNKDIIIGWVAIVEKALLMESEMVCYHYSPDILKFYSLIETHPILTADEKRKIYNKIVERD